MARKLIVDTNLLLHYQSLAQISWALFQTGIDVVIAPVVVRELDKHKFSHPVERIRRRAERVLREFNELLDRATPTVRDGVGIDFLANEPGPGTFLNNRLDPNVQDDRLLATAIELRRSGQDVVIASADTGLKIKAKAVGFSVERPPDETKLPEDPDPQEQENRELRRQLATLKAREPRLSVVFDGSTEPRIQLSRPQDDAPPDFNGLLRQIKAAHPKTQREARRRDPLLGAMPDFSLGVSDSFDVGVLGSAQYDAALDKYYSRYRKYLEEKFNFDRCHRRATELQLRLVNDGTGVADDIHVFVLFPAGLTVLRKEDFPRNPIEPSPPDRSNPASWGLLDGDRLSLGAMLGRVELPQRPDVRMTTEPSGGTRFTFELGRLKQQMSTVLPSLYLVLEPTATSCSVSYAINTGSMPTEREGVLHLIVT